MFREARLGRAAVETIGCREMATGHVSPDSFTHARPSGTAGVV